MVVFSTIRVSPLVKLALAIWCACEILVFALVVHLIGLGDAILVGVITSVLGFTILRRAGSSALAKLRDRMATRQAVPGGLFLDETLATVGALALLLPGFVSDLIGLALAVPALRDAIVAWIGRGGLHAVRTGHRAQHGPSTIDLSPEEWHKADSVGRSIPKA